MNEEHNPFLAPSAIVADQAESPGGYLRNGRRVPIGNGAEWVSNGFSLFRRSIGKWLLVAVVFIILTILLAVIPIVNIISFLILPVFAGGLMLGCQDLEKGEPLRVGHLFTGFSNNLGKLMGAGLIYILGFAIVVIAMALIIPVMSGAAPFDFEQGWGIASMVFVFLLFFIMMLHGAVCLGIIPALVVLEDESVLHALKVGYTAILKNFFSFLVYGIVLVISIIFISIIMSIPFLILFAIIGMSATGEIASIILSLLVWFSTFVFIACTVYSGIRDIFYEQTDAHADSSNSSSLNN